VSAKEISVTDLLAERWRRAQAPRTGDIRLELSMEAAEFLGEPLSEVQRRVDESAAAFPAEWNRLVTDPSSPEQLTRFYNESTTELYEQIAWHAGDAIHGRSFACSGLASTRPGRDFLDFGSGIGSNAIVFGLAGFRVTLADIADPLRNFAKWRCERRGIDVRTIDLKRASLPRAVYDVVTCFDVLEHVPAPLTAVRQIRDSMRAGGILFLHAPFGFDPERPQHIVHADPVTSRMRSLGFAHRREWDTLFQATFGPKPYERVARSALGNAAYYVRDVWMSGSAGDAIARAMRPLMPDRSAGHADMRA
jgi:2-polyprenyl-3-methyl-5-hydroxy-6-metoxy-1,4-benzoquinol methylase